MNTHLRRWTVATVAVALVAAACSSGGTGATDTSAAPTTTPPPTATSAAPETTTTTTAAPTEGPAFVVETSRPYVAAGGDAYAYTTVQDRTQIVTVDIPAAWADVDGTSWNDDDARGFSVVAAADLDVFYSDFSAPGIFAGVSPALADESLDTLSNRWDFSSTCTAQGNHPYVDGTFTGRFDLWTGCGAAEDASLVIVFGTEPDEPLRAIVAIVRDEADLDAVATALDTFRVTEPQILDSDGVVALVADRFGAAVPAAPADAIEVRDDTGTLTVRVPATWTESGGDPWQQGGQEVGPAVGASPDTDAYVNSWDAPGVFFATSESLAAPDAPNQLLDGFDLSRDCTFAGRHPYRGVVDAGWFDLWVDCGSTSAFVVLETYRSDEPFVSHLQIQLVSPDDLPALALILDSYDVLRDAG